MENAKLSFDFKPEDQDLLAQIKAYLAKDQGEVANITAVRWALRQAARQLPASE